VGIVSGLSISLLLVSDFKLGDSEFQYYLASFFIIFIIGIIDDIFVLKAWKKVLGQLLVASLLTAKARLLITDLQGLAGFFEINPIVGYVLTFFTILLVINSFNLIDGIDGLAASLGLISSFAFGLFFYINGNEPYAILGFAMAGSLLAFLMFNFPPARIFYGRFRLYADRTCKCDFADKIYRNRWYCKKFSHSIFHLCRIRNFIDTPSGCFTGFYHTAHKRSFSLCP